jgi:hypothetical protein
MSALKLLATPAVGFVLAKLLGLPQGSLLLRTRRQQDFIAVRLPSNIERMSKNPSTEA